MASCLACGFEAEETFRFCPQCGARLGAVAHEERKVVTALFCDLVGFTALSESADPEDVDRMLAPYFQMVRAHIERHGGVVEKFIGDAIVGLFGVPAAHEDDAERAVHAGLRIAHDAHGLQGLAGKPLRVRVGINTGEALVWVGVAPGSGEAFVTGDVINTASRLQAVAPEMGVAVGLATYDATAALFDYEELKPVELKGKSHPVSVFRARHSRPLTSGAPTPMLERPFVGRELELAQLTGIFDRTVAARAPQLVTVSGGPGVGKSRIVAELGAHVAARAEPVTWRQGRCVPYGEGITFWALGEILKEHTGIFESDSPQTASTKLEAALPGGDEREWFRQRLLPLLGIEGSSTADRDELFTAWRRFLEFIAAERPTVLVIEDLHWADEAMLDFVEYLADRAERVPLLVVATTRPELFERRRGYGAGVRNASAVSLAPLSPAETARLLSALLETPGLPTSLQQPIIERAEGNPLYAEEFVRLLKDRDLLVRAGETWELRRGADLPLPASVQALIAARLDLQAPEAKAMLANAAVVGKVFWVGALAAMGECERAFVVATLAELALNELVQPLSHSTVEGEIEYAFWHILTRDVAYAQLPRASRAARHQAAAVWIESIAGERLGDHADVLAHHYTTALELARVAGQTRQAAELVAPALRFLTLSGERALGLDTNAALASFERALALTPEGYPERPSALARFAEAAHQAGRTGEAARALEEAIASFRAGGDLPAAGEAMATLAKVLFRLGDPRAFTLTAEAVELLEPLAAGPELAVALTELAAAEVIVHGRYREGAGFADQAIAVRAELGMGRSARALGFRGLARTFVGDPGGLEDMREAIALATEAGQGQEAALLHLNLGLALSNFEGPRAALAVMRAGISLSQARGLSDSADLLVANTLDALGEVGEIDQALELAASILDRLGSEEVVTCGVARALRVRLLAARGLSADPSDSLDSLEAGSRSATAADLFVLGLGSVVLGRLALGEDGRAAALLREIESKAAVRESLNYAPLLPALVRAAVAIGDRSLAERLVIGVESRNPYTEHALVAVEAVLAETRGHLHAACGAYAEAAQRWERFGVVPEQAYALLGQGRCLARLGRAAEATAPLRRCRAIFAALQAASALVETDALLSDAIACTS